MTKKILTFGEIMLRMTTEKGGRLSDASHVHMHYGGAEANVAISLAHLGHLSYFVSKVPKHSLGQGVIKHLKANHVQCDHLLLGGNRLGMYFLESGTAQRDPRVLYDRKGSSFSELMSDEVDFKELLRGIDLFHVSGITLALSQSLRDMTYEAVIQARKLGIKVSFDFNYRPALWSHQDAARAIRPILPYVNIAFLGELDAVHILSMSPQTSENKADRLSFYYDELQETFPNISYMASTFRDVQTSSCHFLQGNLFHNGTLTQSEIHPITEIIDRIGSGDAFSSGIMHGLLNGFSNNETVSFATMNAVLKHTISGDCNAFTEEEIRAFSHSKVGVQR